MLTATKSQLHTGTIVKWTSTPSFLTCPCVTMKRNKTMHFLRESSAVYTIRGPGLIQGSSVLRQMCADAGYAALVIGPWIFFSGLQINLKLQDYCDLGNCSCHWSCFKILLCLLPAKKTWFSCLSICIRCLLRYLRISCCPSGAASEGLGYPPGPASYLPGMRYPKLSQMSLDAWV